MDFLIKNPELMKIYQDHQMEERPHLPTQEQFVNYIREQTTIKELASKTSIKKTTIEHWFRRDKAGFSYPTIENWKEIKPHLKTIQFDMEMTTIRKQGMDNQRSNVTNSDSNGSSSTERLRIDGEANTSSQEREDEVSESKRSSKSKNSGTLSTNFKNIRPYQVHQQ